MFGARKPQDFDSIGDAGLKRLDTKAATQLAVTLRTRDPMRPETLAKAKVMLRMLVAGRTLQEIGVQHGVRRSTVERQAKRLIALMVATGCLEPLEEEDEALSVAHIRARSGDVLEALRAFDDNAPTRGQTPCTPALLAAGVERIRARTENANRDIALVYVLLATGAKPIEIARLKVGDYLNADGSVRDVSVLPARASVNGQARPLLFTSSSCVEAVDAYLTERVRRGISGGKTSGYRGLNPAGALFVTEIGQAFDVVPRSDIDPRLICPLILATYRGIFRRAGWEGFTAQKARKWVAAGLKARGAEVGQVGSLLGLNCKRSVNRLVKPRGDLSLEELTKDLV